MLNQSFACLFTSDDLDNIHGVTKYKNRLDVIVTNQWLDVYLLRFNKKNIKLKEYADGFTTVSIYPYTEDAEAYINGDFDKIEYCPARGRYNSAMHRYEIDGIDINAMYATYLNNIYNKKEIATILENLKHINEMKVLINKAVPINKKGELVLSLKDKREILGQVLIDTGLEMQLAIDTHMVLVPKLDVFMQLHTEQTGNNKYKYYVLMFSPTCRILDPMETYATLKIVLADKINLEIVKHD